MRSGNGIRTNAQKDQLNKCDFENKLTRNCFAFIPGFVRPKVPN